MEMYVMKLMGWMRMEMKMEMVQWSEEWKEEFMTLIFILFFMIFSYYYSYSSGIHSSETNSQRNISKVMIGKIAKIRTKKEKLGKWKTYFMSFDDYSHYDNSSITTNVVAHFKWPESINAKGEFSSFHPHTLCKPSNMCRGSIFSSPSCWIMRICTKEVAEGCQENCNVFPPYIPFAIKLNYPWNEETISWVRIPESEQHMCPLSDIAIWRHCCCYCRWLCEHACSSIRWGWGVLLVSPALLNHCFSEHIYVFSWKHTRDFFQYRKHNK